MIRVWQIAQQSVDTEGVRPRMGAACSMSNRTTAPYYVALLSAPMKCNDTYGSSPTTQLSWPGPIEVQSPGVRSTSQPSFINTFARPESTRPMWSTSQRAAPVAAPTCSDHFQPGLVACTSYGHVPDLDDFDFPFSNFRVSSGESNRLINACIGLTPVWSAETYVH